MQPSAATARKLERLRQELQRAFPHLPAEHVDEHLRAVTDDLLAQAKFDDFVPLLAHREAHRLLALEQRTVG